MIMTAELFREAFYRAGDAFLVRDRDTLIDCNDAAARLLGAANRAALLRREPSSLYHSEQSDGRSGSQAEAVDLAHAEAEGSCMITRQLARGDATTFSAQVRLSVVQQNGHALYCLALREIVKGDRTERALEASQSNLRLILDSLPGRVAWIGDDRRFRYVNRSYQAFSGHSPDDIIGRTVAEMIGEIAFEQVRALGEAAMSGVTQHWEGWLPYLDAGRRFVKRTYAPSYREDGVIDGYFVFSLDVTEQKLGEEELQIQREALAQSEKISALGSLLAGVAHELNNPLAIVLAQATLLTEQATDEAVRKRSERVCAAAERCARIVRSFLAIARQRPPKMTNVGLREIVQSALDLTAYGLNSNGITVTVDHPTPVPNVVADADQLVQVLMNLFTNAQHSLEESDGPRRLRITTGLEGDRASIRVADTGRGIAPEIASRIFEPFFTTKAEGVGTGVGLSICHGIVASHDGSLTFEPTPGGGATFVITLPAIRGAAACSRVELATIPGKRYPGSVLIVDDEPDIANLIADIVKPLFTRVEMAANGRLALQETQRHAYDLIISDLRMPELDGPSLYAQLTGGDKPFSGRLLFVTGDTLHHRLEPFIRNTGVPILEKPFEPKELRRTIMEIMEGSGDER